jgi:hypothetical protein
MMMPIRGARAGCGCIPRGRARERHHARMKVVREKLAAKATDETGDVPGWVLISLMTAGLVIAIWAIAGPALGAIFESALARVTGI